MKHLSTIYILSSFIALGTLISCQKETQVITWNNFALTNKHVLHDVHFINADTGYIGGGIYYQEASIFKTVNGGENWEIMSFPTNSIVLGLDWATNKQGFAVGLGNQILTLDTLNQSWQLHQQHFDCGDWLPMHALQMVNDTLGFAVGGGGYNSGVIFRTENGGENWTSQCFDIELRDVFFTTEQIGYAVGYGSIYKTTDSGHTWFLLDIQGDFFTSIHFPTKEVGYAVGNQGLIVKTINSGHSWQVVQQIRGAFQRRYHFADVVFVDEEKGYVVGDHIFQITQNGGTTWKKVEGIDFENFTAITLINDHKGFIVGHNGTVVNFLE